MKKHKKNPPVLGFMATKNDSASCQLVMMAAFLLFLLLFWGGGMMMGAGGMMGGGYWNWNMGEAGLPIQLLFWVAILVLSYFIFRQIMARQDAERPLDVLNRRYAAGEIRRSEYFRMKKELLKK